MNYDGLVSTFGQLRYAKICKEFATLADIVADDEKQTRTVIDWIRLQCTETMSTQMISGGTSILLPSLHLGSHSGASFDTVVKVYKIQNAQKRRMRQENFTLKALWSRVLRNLRYYILVFSCHPCIDTC